jgi:hypothetical protein
MSKISEENDFLMFGSDVISSYDSVKREHPKEFPHSGIKSKE